MDMQYALQTHRGQQPNDSMPLKQLLYNHSKYCKDREEAANAPPPKTIRR